MVSLVVILGVALAVPIFADEIENALNDTTNSSFNDSGNNSSISDNSTLNNTNNSTLTSQQLQTLTETQNKLIALIATIEGLKTTYSDVKAQGLLNALDQFEKQGTRLNDKISAFIQNPSVNSAKGIINSFVKREEALEHKVSVKEEVLSKMDNKTDNSQKALDYSNKSNNGQKQKENKGQDKEQNKGQNK
jgi:hypothetical protein